MKKIIHIVEAFGGGVFTFLVDLINYTSKDYESIVVYAEREQTPENFKAFFDSDVKFIKSDYLTREINFKKDILAIKEIKKILKCEKPDVIHLHSSKAGIIGRIANDGKNCKMIYNPHGFSFLMQDCSIIKKKIYWLIEKIAAFRKCTIVGCSTGEYEEARKLSKNSICINNGVNIKELFKQTKKSNYITNIDEIKICTVARINYQKNPRLFNEIATKFSKINFTWIGDGELKERINSPNIKITGWLSRLEVLNIMQENDIFILTSLWEGLPISLLEAMYMERICIVTDTIGNRDVIKNGINGFVCKNITEFCDVINNIIEKKYDIISIKKAAKEDVEKYYDLNKNIDKYLKLYNS